MRNLLILGGAQFIGANLISRFQKMGKRVTVLADKDLNLWRLAHFMFSVDIKRIDFQDYQTIYNLYKSIKPDLVINATDYGISLNDRAIEKIYVNNFVGPKHLLDVIVKLGCEMMINIGSSREYGLATGAIDENTPLRPVCDYGLAKAMLSLAASKEAASKKLPIYNIKPFDTYGPYTSRTKLVGRLFYSATKGLATSIDAEVDDCYDFLYIDDLIDLIMLLSQKRPAEHKNFNVGNGVCYTVDELVASVEKTLKSNAKIKINYNSQTEEAHPKRFADTTLARNVLSWKPNFDLSQGLEATAKWFSSNVSIYDSSEENAEIGELVSATI